MLSANTVIWCGCCGETFRAEEMDFRKQRTGVECEGWVEYETIACCPYCGADDDFLQEFTFSDDEEEEQD